MTDTVLLISSDAWLRSALPAALERVIDQPVLAVASCESATEHGSASTVLLDSDDTEAPLRQVVADLVGHFQAPVLVLHRDADVDGLTVSLEAGATGFQTKDLTVQELATSIASVQRGEAVVPRRLLGALLGNLITRRRRDEEAVARYERLTRREREILGLVADGEDRESIARSLFISPQTARTHIQNVLTKLEVHSRIEAARFAHLHGYTHEQRRVSS